MSEKVADIEEEPLTWIDGRGRMRMSSKNLAHLCTSKHEQTSSKMTHIECLQHEKVAIHSCYMMLSCAGGIKTSYIVKLTLLLPKSAQSGGAHFVHFFVILIFAGHYCTTALTYVNLASHNFDSSRFLMLSAPCACAPFSASRSGSRRISFP